MHIHQGRALDQCARNEKLKPCPCPINLHCVCFWCEAHDRSETKLSPMVSVFTLHARWIHINLYSVMRWWSSCDCQQARFIETHETGTLLTNVSIIFHYRATKTNPLHLIFNDTERAKSGESTLKNEALTSARAKKRMFVRNILRQITGIFANAKTPYNLE